MAGVGLRVLEVLASIYLIQVSRASCPPGLFGDSCSYSCHCGPSCDLTTGVCDGDCDSGWVKGGGKCQKENVALKRRATTTSGTLGNWNPSGAVDGNIGDLNHRSSCFHANSVPSDWTVDLGRVYHLYDIIVYVRTGYFRRIADSIIYLDNNLSRICFTFPSSSNVNPTDVTCNGTARYVTIRNAGTKWDIDVLNFCEVVIYACSNGTYGVNCDSFCHCPDCDRWTGICSDDCRPGWQGERCDIECTSNVTYGINCSNNCADRKCNGDSSCDRFTGSCDTGCLAGWKENDCRKECDEHHYGITCSALCNQRHCFGSSSCNHVTGSCDQGCDAGWTGQSCDNDCDSDYYGPNCSYACNQRHCSGTSSCDRENGSCDKGCNPGWKGIDCKEACSRLYYGANCSRKCADLHCAGNSSCHHVTGSCDRGCDAGWTGQYCNEACDRDHYGPHCSSVCVNRHCEGASTCSPATGQCDGGCQTGWEGIDCTAFCPPGLFGDSCSYTCHCGSSCDLTTGFCEGDCDAGWAKGGGICQKENVALKRTATTTSGTYKNWIPSGAVDGNTKDLNNGSSCFHAANAPSDWTVDLGRDYQLYDIIVYVRTRWFRRTAESIIYLDNNLTRTCFTFPSSSKKTPTHVKCNGTGKFVTIKNPGTDRANDIINICEVVIYACSNGTYGVNCDSFCQCSDCDRWTGICSGDCRPGWQGERCDIECTSNVTYGINCSNDCADRKCNGVSSCDRFTGSCDTGCLAGWTENDCMKECDELYYGMNCSSLCDERKCFANSSCNHVTGSCDQGCDAGWTGTNCIKECDSDHYGPNCSYACDQRHCSGTSSCDRVNGSCDQGCQTGWMGIDCMEACSRSYYGANCSRKCADLHCAGNSSCHHVTGSCYQGCDVGWTGHNCSKVVSETVGFAKEDTALPVIGGAAVGGIVLLVLIIVLVIVLIRRKRAGNSKESSLPSNPTNRKDKNADPEKAYVNITHDEEKKRSNKEVPAPPFIAPIEMHGADSRSVDSEEKEEDYGSPVEQEEVPDVPERNYYNLNDAREGHVIPVSQLLERVREMEERPELSEEEFKHLPDGFIHPYDISQKPGNKEKNRFRGYYPYNYNRVVLNEANGNRGDYINASFIDGYDCEKQYIAVQGPYKTGIVEDFWRMIWQEGCKVVVMVTGLVEGGKVKCLRYWPEEGSHNYGDVKVTKETENVLADYTITKLTIENGKESKKRHITHFNFTNWPDHGVPDISGLLTFMWRVQNTYGKQKHPIVVHCSAGIGRTGTYIAVESLVSQAAAEGTVDVVSFVSNIRSQRKNMIQTKEQYLFVYQAVTAAVSEGDIALDADTTSKIDLDHVTDVTMGNKTIQQHLETLEQLPVETRASIRTIPSYKTRAGFFVMTSQPEKDNLWNQIYDSNSRTLITWASDDESYLPSDDKPVSTSRLTTRIISSSVIYDNVVRHKIALKRMVRKDAEDGTVIHHYQVTGSVRDPSVSVLIDELLQWTGQSECGSTTIVSRSVIESRLLILLVNITSRFKDDGKVDVINNLRRLQSRLGGPHFTVDDVRLCLEFAQHQLESLGMYANM